MDFFNKLGKKASEACKVTADKTGKLAKEAKLRIKMGELKSEVNDIYEEIGKRVYENHVREEKEDISNELEEKCTKIDCLSDEIDSILKECLELKDKRQCPNCHAEIEKDINFCPKCGAKLEKIKEESANIGESDEEDTSNDNKKQNEEEKSDLEKTVAIESDVDEEHNETVEHLEVEDE